VGEINLYTGTNSFQIGPITLPPANFTIKNVNCSDSKERGNIVLSANLTEGLINSNFKEARLIIKIK
jgi:hypothetical protein